MKQITKDSIDVLKHIIWYVVILLVLVVICLVIKYCFGSSIVGFDEIILLYINDNFVSDKITNIVKIITIFGSAWVLVPLTLIIIFVVKNKKYGFIIGLNLLFVYLLNVIIKNIFVRPRPEVALIDEVGYSFPSSHTMCSIAFYGLLIFIISKKIKNKSIKYISIILLATLIALIAFSRLYLQVHYLTDVIMGLVYGLICLLIFLNILKYMLKEK